MPDGLARLVNGEQRLRLAGHPLASARRVARGMAGLAFNHQGLRRRIVRTLAFHAIARTTPVVAVEEDGLRFLVETADLGPGRIIFTRGSLERDVLESAVEALGLAGGDLARRYFVDVGANIGTASMLALTRHGFQAALAIEPNADNAALLRANLAINGLEDRCRTVVAAAGEKDGSAELEVSPDNFGDHRVRDARSGPGEFREESRAVRHVPLRTLDAILATQGVVPDEVGLVWVDVQGYEAHVLLGAPALLAAAVPVVIEFWPYGLRRSGGLEALCELVEAHFTHFVELQGGGNGNGAAARLPVERLRAFEPMNEEGADATDVLLVP